MNQFQFEIRPPEASDLNFIQATFIKSMKSESSLGRSCSPRVFFAEFTRVIDHILAKSEILIACVKEDPGIILGYLIYEQNVIHYAFTKAAFRRLDIARDLIRHAFPDQKSVLFSQNTNSSKKICEKYPELIFNPFLLYERSA